MNQLDSSIPDLSKIVSLAKRRGFVFPTSEIYGGLANCYDYGPLGAQLLKNIRQAWWQTFIEHRADMVGLDSQIILHPQTWVASGHVASFTDPLVEDKKTHKRYRADHLIEQWVQAQSNQALESLVIEDMTTTEMNAFIQKHHLKSPEGNALDEVKTFNLLFETEIGAVSDDKSKIYLRGETAQGIFTNFKQVLDSSRATLPFGVGQIGKSFRNEITTGQFVFRTLEFEQAEIEYFFDPSQTNWETLFKQWQADMETFVTTQLGIGKTHLRWRQHTDKERSHYSKDTWDLDYQFPFGWKELWGIAYRTDYDLKQHMQFSGQSLEYQDPYSGKKLIPHVIEPALGINRLFFMILCEGFWEDKDHNRIVLKLKPNLAPYEVAVFPLVKNKPEIVAKAKTVFDGLKYQLRTTWDDRGNIGKRYYTQDEIGTPFCVTIDYGTLENGQVTVRDRDSMQQEMVNVSQVSAFLTTKLQA